MKVWRQITISDLTYNFDIYDVSRLESRETLVKLILILIKILYL